MYKNVIIVGATGYFIGTKITSAFLERKDEFNTSILVSKRAMQDDGKRKILQDFEKRGAQLVFGELDNSEELEEAFQGINAVICLITGNEEKLVLDGQKALIAAAKKAHVTRFITSDYGLELSRIRKGEVAYYDPKKCIQELLEADLTLEHTFIATGVFADFLLSPAFGIDLKGRKITAFGPSDMKMSSCHSDDVGILVPDILLAAGSKNARIDIASFTTTFAEILIDVEKIFGEKFEFAHESEEELLQHVNSEDPIEKIIARVKMIYSRGDGYFEKPFNKIHPVLSKIKTLSVEDIIKKAMKA